MPKLIGTSLNQVPTHGMLGGMAYQSPSNVTVDDLNLDILNANITSNAVYTFIYDTRRDSDGGSWRKRTQNTSWYNETLNTATRGSRRDFPAVAIFVVTATEMTIYDGDDPEFPMWMVFSNVGQVTLNWGTSGTSNLTSCAALNGVIVITTSGSGGLVFNMIKDDIKLAYQDNPYGLRNGRYITDRNNSVVGSQWIANSDGYPLLSGLNAQYHVSMAVTPDSVIDASTGLPNPTIAISGATGISIIRSNEAVISTSGSTKVSKVNIYNSGKITALFSQSNDTNFAGFFCHNFEKLGGSDIATYNTAADGIVYHYRYYDNAVSTTASSQNINVNNFIEQGLAMNEGLTFFNRYDSFIGSTAGGQSMTALAKTTYNTGWMVGDVRGVLLTNTVAEDIVATEFVTNGDFASGTTGWTAVGNTGFAVASGVGTITMTATNGQIEQNIGTIVAGQTYAFTMDWTGGTGSNIYVGLVDRTSNTTQYSLIIDASGPGATNKRLYTTFTASSTSSNLKLAIYGYYWGGTGNGITLSFDNISLTVTDSDRSPTNYVKPIAVYGTVSKTKVATDSDLVQYGNFSSTNYMMQGNVNINFANPWYIMGWFPTNSGTVSLEKLSTSGYNNTIAAIFAGVGTQSSRSKFSDLSDSSTSEKFFALVYSGGVLRHYAGDRLIRSITGKYTTETADLFIGKRSYNGVYDAVNSGQQIALLRYGQSFITEEQIRKIYNDEKALFTTGAKCTLYGSSNVVTAIAYDDTAQLLHAGTSGGRSVFDGLRRVDYTTSPVTTWIAASNNLIVEQ
jgi:trimeric autotransporter adhesin